VGSRGGSLGGFSKMKSARQKTNEQSCWVSLVLTQ
jgi:hypothetical protein